MTTKFTPRFTAAETIASCRRWLAEIEGVKGWEDVPELKGTHDYVSAELAKVESDPAAWDAAHAEYERQEKAHRESSDDVLEGLFGFEWKGA